MAATFENLRKAMAHPRTFITGPYYCYVGNFFSAAWPHQFTYRACTYIEDDNEMCRKPIEASDGCSHFPLRDGYDDYLYRFELLLFDARSAGPPVRVLIRESAHKLIKSPASDFQRLDDSHQLAILHGVCYDAPMVRVWLRTLGSSRDSKPIVDRLDIVDTYDNNVPEEDRIQVNHLTLRLDSEDAVSVAGGNLDIPCGEADLLRRSVAVAHSILSRVSFHEDKNST